MIRNIKIKRHIWMLLFSSIVLLCFTAASYAAIIQVDPRSTYLHTNNDPFALDPVVINLSNYGINVGDTVALELDGNFSFYSHKVVTGVPIFGVFSSTDDILPPSELHRIPGAIDAGPDVITDTTYFGGEPTDIPEDFMINQYGEGNVAGKFLILGFNDSYFGDNRYVLADGSLSTYPDESYGGFEFNLVRTRSARVPEPTTLFLLGSGLVIFGGLMRKKFRK